MARYRVPVRIIDKAPSRTDKSKALVVWARTLELLDRSGCAKAFVASGLEGEGMSIFSGKERANRSPLRSTISDRRSSSLLIPQSETERLLDTHLQALRRQDRTKSASWIRFSPISGDGVSCTSSRRRRARGKDHRGELG